ncbi:hypothetical protein QVH35_08165 [Candidatus Nitrosotenuis chungbukensis]|uniref:hypothetical protein n=1 Tax=Candidatus Nitrosotenuis chungbukensis TaxID=1353246 RepID=UPI0026741264|nr:hypothetical protein [Candidatus Nitrosotenuis chungbukensis]WKT57369.1 hypothetical protein QVH35_08165 [Candidatus Nitrosotenuis chungbukensis]
MTRSKTEVISIISKEAKAKMPQLGTLDDVKKATELASQALKKIGDVLGKNSRVIHVFAKKYAQDLKDHLATINTNYMSALQLLDNYVKFESDESLIKEKTNKIIDMIQIITDKSAQIPKLKTMHDHLAASISEAKSKTDLLKSSPQHAKYLEIKNQIEQNKKEENKLYKEIDEEFSKISRPLGKYFYVTSLEKPLKILMEDLIHDPAKTITTQNKGSIIVILESCMKGTLSGAVSVKEADKSVDHISAIIRKIDDFLVRKNALMQKDQDLQSQLGIFDIDAFEELEQKLQKTITDKNDMESKIKKLESDLAQETSNRAHAISELGRDLQSISNTKYVILV